MNCINYIQDNWKQIGEALEVVGANVYAFYAFVSNHGGLIPMWRKFAGTSPVSAAAQPATTEPQPATPAKP